MVRPWSAHFLTKCEQIIRLPLSKELEFRRELKNTLILVTFSKLTTYRNLVRSISYIYNWSQMNIDSKGVTSKTSDCPTFNDVEVSREGNLTNLFARMNPL